MRLITHHDGLKKSCTLTVNGRPVNKPCASIHSLASPCAVYDIRICAYDAASATSNFTLHASPVVLWGQALMCMGRGVGVAVWQNTTPT